MRWMRPSDIDRPRSRVPFDAVREGARHGCSPELSLAIWKQVCAQRLGVDDLPRLVLFPAPSKEEVIVQLRQRHRRGAAMTGVAVSRNDGRLYHGALKHFGTWRNTMQSIVLGDLELRVAAKTVGP